MNVIDPPSFIQRSLPIQFPCDPVSAMQFGAHGVEYGMGEGEETLPVLEHPLAGMGVGKVSDGWDAAIGMDGRDTGVFSM